MAEYKSEELGVRLVVPDRLTVAQQLRYRSLVPMPGADRFEKYWDASRQVITEWTGAEQDEDGNYKPCTLVPKLDVDLDDLHDPQAADAITFAINVVAGHMNRLEADTVPKNS